MSALDFCEGCNGNGSTFETVTSDVPGLTSVMRKRIAQGRAAVLAKPCTQCDGQDRATAYHESIAEENHA